MFSLYDLLCIILTIRKQIIAFKKGAFAPPTEKQEGGSRCLLSSVCSLDGTSCSEVPCCRYQTSSCKERTSLYIVNAAC